MASRSPSYTEHDLVTRVRRGDDRAFEELYTRYRRRIGSYVLGMVGDHGRAEDITQEVFISALRRMRDTERPIAFKPWIYEIAKNACIDNARRSSRGHEVSLDADNEPVERLAAYRSAPPPETTVETKQSLDDLCGAFGCLSATHHEILVLRELEGLSYKEIGERLGMSRPVVESTLFRARRRLGEEYEELVSGRRCEHVQALVHSTESRSLGIRERRRLARHLAHCQPCRRQAKLAGFDDLAIKPTRRVAGLAGLLPIPLLRLRGAFLRARSLPSDVAASTWQSPLLVRSVDAFSRFGDAAGGSVGFGRAAAAIAAITLTGAGAGLLPESGHSPVARSAPALRIQAPAPAARQRSTAIPTPPSTQGKLRHPAKVAAIATPGRRPAIRPLGSSAAEPRPGPVEASRSQTAKPARGGPIPGKAPALNPGGAPAAGLPSVPPPSRGSVPAPALPPVAISRMPIAPNPSLGSAPAALKSALDALGRGGSGTSS